MRHALAIAARDIRERKMLFLLAVAMMLMSLLATAMPFAGTGGRSQVLVFSAFVLSTNLAVIVSMVLGITMIGRDLSDRRLSFYFSRPVSAASIWFGKLIAAVVSVIAVFVVVLAPALLFARDVWMTVLDITPSTLFALVAGGSVGLILLANAVSTMVRSRSALLGLDFLGVALFGVAVALMVTMLVRAMALKLLLIVLGSLVGALMLVLAGAGAWQLSRGRTDVRRSHAELSKFLWGGLAIVTAITGGYLLWVASARPRDLKQVEVRAAAGSDSVVISGVSPMRVDYRSVFLLREGKRPVKLPAAPWQVDFTPSGNLLWASHQTFSPGVRKDLYVTRLDGDAPRTQETGITVSWSERIATSPDDRIVAVLDEKVLSIHDLAKKRLLMSTRFDGQHVKMFFVSPDRLRLIVHEPFADLNATQTVRILECDVTRRSMEQTGQYTAPATAVAGTAGARGNRMFLTGNRDGSRLLVQRMRAEGARPWKHRELLLLDGRTAAPLAEMRDVLPGFGTGFLADGTVYATGMTEDAAHLQLFGGDGSVARDIVLEQRVGAGRLIQYAPRRAIVAVWPRGQHGLASGRATTLVLDLERGTVVNRVAGIRPGVWLPVEFWWTDPRRRASLGPRVLMTRDHTETKTARDAHFLWNPETGEKRPLIAE